MPFIALGIVGWQVWNDLLHWSDVAVFLIMYLVTGLGVTVGFHRHLTHRAFKAKPWVHGGLAIMGSMAIEGPVTAWVADHRKHHAFADKEGDPHSPHVGHEGGCARRAQRASSTHTWAGSSSTPTAAPRPATRRTSRRTR